SVGVNGMTAEGTNWTPCGHYFTGPFGESTGHTDRHLNPQKCVGSWFLLCEFLFDVSFIYCVCLQHHLCHGEFSAYVHGAYPEEFDNLFQRFIIDQFHGGMRWDAVWISLESAQFIKNLVDHLCYQRRLLFL